MAWFARKKHYDRSRIVTAAAHARKRRKPRKAIALYRQVLEVEPDNPDLHRKIAPLLVQTKRADEAWASYRRAVEGLLRRGFLEQAIGVSREASDHLHRNPEVWRALAGLELQRERRADAVEVLLEGRRHFRSRRHRSEATRLLFDARKIDRHHFQANFDLAGLLARSGARPRAASLLEELVPRSKASQLRRIRARQLWIAPSPGTLWRWLQSRRPSREQQKLLPE
jgi:tetratricopeptide (TPR) repeat protein